MTDDVCDSWEDVDPDKIVIQKPPNNKSTTNNNRPTYSSILAGGGGGSGAAATTGGSVGNSAFHIEHREDKIIVGNDSESNGTGGTGGGGPSSVRILQRVSNATGTNNNADLPIFTNQPNIFLEDNTRTQFVKGLRILNRPNKSATSVADKTETKLTEDEFQEKFRRRVEEKQANYSKARLRIMGEEMPDEDRVANALNSVNFQGLNTSGGTKPSASSSSQQPHRHGQTAATLSSPPSLSLQSSLISSSATIQQQQQNLLRQPTAPDGTRGFHHHPNMHQQQQQQRP